MTSIPKLRLKIILSSMSVLVLILACMLVSLNVFLLRNEMNEAREFLHQMAAHEGYHPPHVKAGFLHLFLSKLPASDVFFLRSDPSSPLRDSDINLRYSFSVQLSGSNKVIRAIHDYPLPYTSAEIHQIVSDILREKKTQGNIRGIMYYISPREHGERLLCLINMQNGLYFFKMLVIYSFVVFFFFIFAALLVTWFLSGLISRPVEEAFEKQKRFLSDAGHELKAPISVIEANIDVLSSDLGENKWLGYIKTENERMGKLVKNLLYLARSDADRQIMNTQPFDFSLAVTNAALAFESVAFEQGKKLTITVAPQLHTVGDEAMIKQVVMILVDNALKNSNKGAKILVTAYGEGQKKVLKVFNTGYGIQAENYEKIFERFYREDSSRNRNTGGYGLGLPIARTIARAHHGTLTVTSKYGEWAEFTLRLPK